MPGRSAPIRPAPSPAPSGGALPVVSVRTAGEVPKEKVLDVARALCRVHLTAPVQAGDVVIPNVLGTGVDVVATRSV